MSWIKIQNGLVSNKKTARLAREMKWSKLQTVGFLISFWIWAIENCEDGLLKDTSDTEIAFGVGVESMDGIKVALITVGLLDENPLRIHDWVEHQHDFLWGKYKDKPEKRSELLQNYPGVTLELHSRKTERKKERKIYKEGGVLTTPPTLNDVREMAEAEHLAADPDKFFHWQESKAWAGVSDWKAAFRYWDKQEYLRKQQPQHTPSTKINPAENHFKFLSHTKLTNDFHDKHTSGGICSFCGKKIEGMGICECASYTSAFEKFRGGLK